jgi:capsular polysaccharide biosynthesis protein
MTPSTPIPLAPYAAVPGAETLLLQPASRYDSRPPALVDFRPADMAQGRECLAVLSRPLVPCRPEAVMLYRDALVLDGSYVLSRDGVAVRESYYNVPVNAALAERQHWQLARIAGGHVTPVGPQGPPVVALFLQDCNNFGHVLSEMLPRLLLLRDAGLRDIRLLLPDAAAPFLPMIGFTLGALGMQAEMLSCPHGSIMRVPALHWPSLVGEGWFKSPTVRRLFDALREAVPAALGPAATGPARLFVTRPAGGRRDIPNAAEAAALAEARGYVVVEPSALPFPEQLALFAGAGRVAGPLGAALTLTGAMAPGGQVGMLGPGYCDYFYWDLACLADLGFAWAFVEPVERFRPELLNRPLPLPPRLLARVLDTLEG